MTDDQVLKIIEKMGPEAADAFDSWMSLQWTKFWFLDVLAPIGILLIVIVMVFVLFYLPLGVWSKITKSEES